MFMETQRRYSLQDSLVLGLEALLAGATRERRPAQRPSPARRLRGATLPEGERAESARLMRVNHAGEVAAQGLYLGQALTARRAELRAHLREAAGEEADHLAWCRDRLDHLGGAPSRLEPLWFWGSVGIGALAGLSGDRRSLGFVVETERQVEAHLHGHLRRLPPADIHSRTVLRQMRRDEAGHADRAARGGGGRLPLPVRTAMRLASRIMTGTAYRL